MAATGYYNPLLAGVLGGSPGVQSNVAQQMAGSGYQMGPLSQLAYQMAGSPQRGPFADQGTPPAVPGMNSTSAGATGPGTGNSFGTAALSLLAKNPNLISNLLGTGAAAYGSGAAADAAVTGALGSVGAQTAGDAAAISAANSAALSGGGVFGSAGTAAGTAASTGSGAAAGGTAAGGSSSLLGAAGALAIPAAIAAAGLLSNGVEVPNQDFVNLLNTVQQGQAKGYTQANPMVSGGVADPGWAAWNNALQELQGGSYQTNEPWIKQALNQLGYQEYGQMTPGAILGSGGGGSSGSGASRSSSKN